MADSRPEALTIKGMATDITVSIVFLLGTALVDYIKRHLAVDSSFTGALLLAFELTLMCFALGYVLRAATYLWDQFSYFIEHIATSPTWPRLKAGAKLALSGAIWALRAMLTLAVVALVAVIIWSALLAPMHHFGIEMSRVIGKLEEFLGIHRFGPPVEPQLPTPLETQIVFAVVLGVLILGWSIRGVSYFIQRRWLSVQA